MTQDEFDRFLLWLHPDREEAGTEYVRIRCKLVYIFIGRGCAEPEDLADEAINRVIRLVQDIADTYVGDRALYFYRVANYVRLELCKPRPPVPPMPPPDPAHIKELRYQCLEDCLKGLPPDDAKLVTGYFKEDKRAKIERHRELAEQRGITPNALRIRIHRILAILRVCVKGCLAQTLSE
jgi:DNA-directed RNA polymerase specialized sigma24 family protein